MSFIVPLALAGLMALAIIVIGSFYVFAPQRVTGQFGLKPPAPDADTQAWLRLKGIRDVSTGLVVLTLMLTTDARTVGIALLGFSLIAIGDMVNVLASRGSRAAAFSIHGVTALVMVVSGLFLIRAL